MSLIARAKAARAARTAERVQAIRDLRRALRDGDSIPEPVLYLSENQPIIREGRYRDFRGNDDLLQRTNEQFSFETNISSIINGLELPSGTFSVTPGLGQTGDPEPNRAAANAGLPAKVGALGQHLRQTFGASSMGHWREQGLPCGPSSGTGRSCTSDHLWGGALDLGFNAYDNAPGGSGRRGDLLAKWANAQVGRGVRNVIWRSAHHFDHVHISFSKGWTGPLPYPTRDVLAQLGRN